MQADFLVAKQFCDMEAIYTYEGGCTGSKPAWCGRLLCVLQSQIRPARAPHACGPANALDGALLDSEIDAAAPCCAARPGRHL